MAGTTYNVTFNRAKITPLSETEAAFGENTIKYHIDYTDVAVAAATGSTDVINFILGSTPAQWMVTNGKVNITTAFAGTTALTLTVGTSSSVAAFVSSASVLTAGVLPAVTTLASLTNANGTAAVSFVAVFTNATGGSPSALTAGALDIYLNVLPQAIG